jgi:hypothetical protein
MNAMFPQRFTCYCATPKFPEDERKTATGCRMFEVFTAVTMKNVFFWDIKTQFVPHKKHTTSPLQSPAG